MQTDSTETIEAVFFDFEGTVVDFQWNLKDAVEEALSALEAAGYQRHHFGDTPGYAFIYNHAIDLSLREAPGAKGRAVKAVIDPIFDHYDNDALTRWQLQKDTHEVLSFLKTQRFKLGMISNIGGAALSAALDRLAISPFFNVILSRNDMTRIKPHPEGLITAAKRLHVAPSRVLFVGDSRNDVAAATAAGMRSCYLIGGEDTPAQVASFSKTYSISALSQIAELDIVATDRRK